MEYYVQQNICRFQQLGTFCDVSLQGILFRKSTEECQLIKAHRVILASCCDYFKAMFTLDMIESRKSSIKIENVRHDVLEKIVEYCYTGVIDINDENVHNILFAANFFKINKIEDQCVQFLDTRVNFRNVFQISEIAKRFSYKRLMRKTRNYALRHYHACSKTKVFLKLSIEDLRELISNKNLNIIQEKDFYESILRWVKHDVSKRSKYLNELLGNVLFNHLDRSFLLKDVAKEPLIINSADNRQHLYKALDYHLSSNVKKERPVSPLIRRRNAMKILFIGGKNENGIQNSMTIFHISTKKWETGPGLKVPRTHATVVVVDDFVFCLGGIDAEGRDLMSVEKYDCMTNEWIHGPNLRQCKGSLQAIHLDKTIYVMGGSNENEALDFVETLDTESIDQQWKPMQSMPTKRRNFTLVNFCDQICVIGGYDGKNVTDSCTFFEPSKVGKWSDMGLLNKPRMDHAAAVTGAHKLYVYGGRKDEGFLDCIEKYNRELNMWLIIKHTFQASIGAMMLYVKSSAGVDMEEDSSESQSLFIIGGCDENARFIDTMNIIDLESVDYDIKKDARTECKVAFAASCIV